MTPEQLARLDQLYPDFRDRVLLAIQAVKERTGRDMFPIETFRSITRQRKLYEQGRIFDPKTHVWSVISKVSIVTNAPPGMSLHHYGLAADLGFIGGDPYLRGESKTIERVLWADYGRSVMEQGLRWGGDWNGNGRQDPNDFDRPHCEKSYGVKTQTLLAALQSPNGIQAVWRALDRERCVS